MRRVMQVKWLLLFSFLLCLPSVQAHSHHSHDASNSSIITVAELPQEAQYSLQLILRNGPFPYARDGVVFGNYEHILPQQPRGYYHEYTVKTHGANNRGARRIVCGNVTECYYSDDHYQSFKRIREINR